MRVAGFREPFPRLGDPALGNIDLTGQGVDVCELDGGENASAGRKEDARVAFDLDVRSECVIDMA